MFVIVHLFFGSDNVPAGFISHYKTLTVCCYEALPIEEQAWKLHKQQEGVPVCKETTAFLLFRTSFITCYLIKLAYVVYWNLL